MNPSGFYVDPILPYFVFCEKIKNPDCRNQDFTVFFSSRWCHQESNRGHKDFQSFALPTELWHLADLRVQRYAFYSVLPNEYLNIFEKNAFFVQISGYFAKNAQLCNQP